METTSRKKTIFNFEPEIDEYLKLKKSESTIRGYSNGFADFLEFYRGKYGKEANFSHLLDRIFSELKKDRREQGRIAEIEITEFISYLKDKKLANNTIRLYFAALQNFLKYKGVVVSMGFIDLPPPTEKTDGNGGEMNGKHEWTKEQIKQFVDSATTYRDKAIILCLYQSGLGLNEVCKLNYGHVKDELEAGMSPICLKLVRQKTSVKFKTFFGRDAVHYLKLYLATRGKLKPEDPLFVKERVGENSESRINKGIIEIMFLEIARRSNFIHFNGGYNPARPHSLRAAFNSMLVNKIDPELREFWMGHCIGTVAKAYLTMPTEELRQLYMTAETYLKIEKTSREEQEEVSGVNNEAVTKMSEKVHNVEKSVVDQAQEITKLKEELSKQKEYFDELVKAITNESVGQFREWLNNKRKAEFEQVDNEEKRKIVLFEKAENKKKQST